MEEGAPSSVAWWKYVVWSVLIAAVFFSSIAGGHWWSSRSYRAPQESANTTSDTPTQRMPGPVVLEVASELEAVRLQGSVDTAALAHWWQVLGVNAQALTFKELGGFPTYTPHSVKIVIKDISPLSLSQRQALFNPVTGGQSSEIIAGSATVYDPAQPERLEYYVYHDPTLYSPEYPEITEENINRVLFETLYVAVVGSTALTSDDYTAKRETAFPPGGGWQGIVKLEGTGTSGLWHTARGALAESVQKLRQWRLVPQAHAQSCGGTFYCGVSSTQCKCTGNGTACFVHGQSCGGITAGTCNCTTTCPSDPNLKTDCVKIGNTCGPRSNSCSNCVSEDFYTCAWSGPTPTTAASCGNGTCGSGESCSNCPADCGTCSSGRCNVAGKVEKYDNLNLNNANGVVSLWSSLGVNTAGTNGSGNYAFGKNYDNVGDTIKVYVNNPYSTYRTFKVKGNVPNGCTIQDDGKTISCPKDKCFERADGDLAFNFEEVAPPAVNTVPNAAIEDVVNLTYGQTLPWTVKATDANGNLQSAGIYIHSGTPPLGESNGWKPLGWVGGQNTSAMTFRHSDRSGVTPWTCNSGNQGTWTLTTNAVDTAGLKCSGNPIGSVPRCASNPNDRKTFTCSPPPQCAAPSLTVNRTCNGTNSTDALSWGAISSCSWYQITWGNDNTPSDWPAGNNFAANSTSKTFTGVNGNNQQCYRVKCTNASACNATGAQSSIVCKPACPPSNCASPSGLSCGGSCSANNNMVVNCSWTRDTRVSGYLFTYDSIGTNPTNINLTTSGTSANATYTMSTPLPNRQYWFRVSNLTSNGSCTASTNQTSNTSTAGPVSCATPQCIGGVAPAASNSSICAGDQSGLTANESWKRVASAAQCTTGSNTTKCQWYCDAGHTFNSSTNTCQPINYTCGGTRPANTLYYNNDDEPTGSGSTWRYSSTNTTAKCEYFCDTGYQWNTGTGACELPANSCAAPVIASGSITCTNGGTLTGSWNAVTGARTYQYQRNTSASTTGAVQGSLSGTSFSVATANPAVTNYFRVRVQTVSGSAVCTDPGEWSAWRSVSGNSSCVTPTSPPTCDQPIGVNGSSSCNPTTYVGNIAVNWDKMTSAVNGYEYQLSRSNDWDASNRVHTSTMAQPLGSVRPSYAYTYPAANPPNLFFRTRSVCAGNVLSSWTPWRSFVFSPSACGGPTPTPLPYNVTVNLRATENVCDDSKPLLSGSFTGRVIANPVAAGSNRVINVSTAESTFQNLQGTHIVGPSFADFSSGDDSPSWTKATGPTCLAQQTVTGATELNFYFTQVKGPWWQSRFGDIFGNVLSSKIPTTATNKNLSISSGGSEAGAVAWNSTLDLSTGSPSQKGFRVGNEALPFREDYAYFASKLNNEVQNVNGNDINTIQPGSTKYYHLTGNQTLSSNWNVTGKVVVLIDGPNAGLTVGGDKPITISAGGFVFFIVNGPITFAADVDQVYGMFLAHDDLTILHDISNQEPFQGHGSFISTHGDIVSHRSLAGSANSTAPATEFIYDPALVLSTPPELRSNTTVWQEVAP